MLWLLFIMTIIIIISSSSISSILIIICLIVMIRFGIVLSSLVGASNATSAGAMAFADV